MKVRQWGCVPEPTIWGGGGLITAEWGQRRLNCCILPNTVDGRNPAPLSNHGKSRVVVIYRGMIRNDHSRVS